MTRNIPLEVAPTLNALCFLRSFVNLLLSRSSWCGAEDDKGTVTLVLIIKLVMPTAPVPSQSSGIFGILGAFTCHRAWVGISKHPSKTVLLNQAMRTGQMAKSKLW